MTLSSLCRDTSFSLLHQYLDSLLHLLRNYLHIFPCKFFKIFLIGFPSEQRVLWHDINAVEWDAYER